MHYLGLESVRPDSGRATAFAATRTDELSVPKVRDATLRQRRSRRRRRVHEGQSAPQEKKLLKIINACSVDTIFPVFNKAPSLWSRARDHPGQKKKFKNPPNPYCFLYSPYSSFFPVLPYTATAVLPCVIQDHSVKLRFLTRPSQILFTLPELHCTSSQKGEVRGSFSTAHASKPTPKTYRNISSTQA